MAEIHVERKRGVSPLVWILVLLVLAALAWFIYSMSVVEQSPVQTAPATTTSERAPARLALAA